MPLVQVEILKGRPADERQQLFDAVPGALVQAFSIPEDGRIQRIVEHEPENFEIPPGASERQTRRRRAAGLGQGATGTLLPPILLHATATPD